MISSISHSSQSFHNLYLSMYVFLSFLYSLTAFVCLSSSYHIAYFAVHSLAVALCWVTLFLSNCAISGTRGSSGFGSVSNELAIHGDSNNNNNNNNNNNVRNSDSDDDTKANNTSLLQRKDKDKSKDKAKENSYK